MALRFSSKAGTLRSLEGLLRSADVLPQRTFTVADWKRGRIACLATLASEPWGGGRLIVRSSAVVEDSETESMAGHFTSVAAVSGSRQLESAIDEVIGSYGDAQDDDEVLVQPMLLDVDYSGVAFSIEPKTGSPYRVINYDDTGDQTSAVTGGRKATLRTFMVFRGMEQYLPPAVAKVLELINELETLFETDRIQLEFAGASGVLYLLQARPLTKVTPVRISEEKLKRLLGRIENKIDRLNRRHPYLHGPRTVLGVMPDWNPAEMLGIRPRPLAASLYRELITDNIWAYQRRNYGYLNVRSFPLLLSLGGQPYIDARVSFNSFVPADVPPELADKLVAYYLDALVENPSAHDKVEFEVVFTCFSFDLADRLERLERNGFTTAECGILAECLRRLTQRIIHPEDGLWRQDLGRVQELNARIPRIVDSDLGLVEKIYWLLEDCKRYGTLPFAGLARAAFIAVQLLESLESTGVLERQEREHFLSTLNTVSSQMARDLAELQRGPFLERYGHLRPGTYDVLSKRYDEDPDYYFDWAQQYQPPVRVEEFRLSLEQMRRTEELLESAGLAGHVLGLFDFIRSAIEGREYAKFLFTRSVSEVLRLFSRLGAEHGLSVDDCSYANIEIIRELYVSTADVGACLRRSIDAGRHGYAATTQIALPPLVTKGSDVWSFEIPCGRPNFMTQKRVSALRVTLDDPRDRLRGAILFIPCADPGFDWIFSHGIAVFVTKYGGVNSHMAVRATELGIPAVVGSGELLYEQWAAAQVLEVDCVNEQVRILR